MWLRLPLVVATIWIAGFASLGAASEYGKVTSHEVATGIYLFTTAPYGDVGLCGNSVAIISDDGVLVFDSGGTPETARAILSEIRKLTPKPVRYLVNSHWHWDHWGGNQVYAEAFPGLQIISHEKTRELMLSVEPRWNGKGLDVDLPHYLDDFQKRVATAKANHAPEARIQQMEKLLTADRSFLAQKQSLRKTYPNVTFSDAMTLQLGGRTIQILHARAITPGDTYLYLPKEKVLITGDILLAPYPFAIGGTYPADWLSTLNKFAQLEPAVIVPGHGPPQNDPKSLQSYIALFKQIIQEVADAKAKNLTADQTLEMIAQQNNALAAKLGIQDNDGAAAFKAYFLDVFVKRAHRELGEPLGDLPDGLQ